MKQDRMKQTDRQRTDMEPAEESREKARGGRGSSSERGLDDTRQSGGTKSRSGITNRDLEREEFEQDQLPERGQSSDSER